MKDTLHKLDVYATKYLHSHRLLTLPLPPGHIVTEQLAQELILLPPSRFLSHDRYELEVTAVNVSVVFVHPLQLAVSDWFLKSRDLRHGYAIVCNKNCAVHFTLLHAFGTVK